MTSKTPKPRPAREQSGTKTRTGSTRQAAIKGAVSLRKKLRELARNAGKTDLEINRRYELLLRKVVARVASKYETDITRDPVPTPLPKKRGGGAK